MSPSPSGPPTVAGRITRGLRRLARAPRGVVRRLRRRLGRAGPSVPRVLAHGAVVVVDRGAATPAVVRTVSQLRPAVVLADHPPRALARLPITTALADLVTVGGPLDEALAVRARDVAGRVCDRLAEVLPRDVARHASVDLVGEVLRFELQAALLQHLRWREGALQRLDPEHTPAVLLVGGTRGPTQALAPELLARLGPRRVHELAADGVRVRPAAPRRARPGQVPDPVPGDLPDPVPGDLPVHAPVHAEPHPLVGRPCVLAWPLRNHVLSLLPVVRTLAASGAVGVLGLASNARGRALLEPYALLATQEALPVEVRDDLVATAPSGAPPADTLAARCAAAADVAAALLERDPVPDPVLRHVTPDEVRRLVAGLLPRAHRLAAAIDQHLAHDRPGVVVLSRERGWQNRVGALVARGRGIPTVLVQASLLGPSARHAPAPTDHATVLDHDAARLHVDHLGVAPDRVHVTGMPGLDDLRGRARPSAADALATPPRVLVAMQRTSLDEGDRLLTEVVGAVERADPSATVVVKAHPKSPASLVAAHERAARAAATRCTVELVAQGDIRELLADATLVVSGWSTTLLEAALVGTPALAVSLDGTPLPVPLDELGVVHLARSAAELDVAIAGLLGAGELRAQARQRQADYLDTNRHLVAGPTATERVATTILAIAQRSPRACASS